MIPSPFDRVKVPDARAKHLLTRRFLPPRLGTAYYIRQANIHHATQSLPTATAQQAQAKKLTTGLDDARGRHAVAAHDARFLDRGGAAMLLAVAQLLGEIGATDPAAHATLLNAAYFSLAPRRDDAGKVDAAFAGCMQQNSKKKHVRDHHEY